MKTLTLLLFGTFSLSQPLGFTLHFSCCKIKAVLSFCSIHVLYPYPHRAWQQMDLRFFPHASKHKCDNACTDTCRSDCCPLRDPCRQQSWQAAILAGIDPRRLSRYRSFAATFTPGDRRSLGDHALVLWHCLHLALFRRSSLLSNPLVHLVVRWVKIFAG